jgi:hypothetical protein
MAIYKYNEGEHGGGFIGLRVAVMVNKKLKQKHFSFIVGSSWVSLDEEKALEEKAKQLEDSWKYQQQSASEKRHNQAQERQSSVYSTGVRGIKMKFITMNRTRAGELRTYYTPAFIVSGSNNNKRFTKSFNIITQGYQSAWTYAVLYYAMNKNLNEPGDLLKRLPPVEKFMIIIKAMHKSGHKVPKRRLPEELWNNSQVRMALGKME